MPLFHDKWRLNLGLSDLWWHRSLVYVYQAASTYRSITIDLLRSFQQYLVSDLLAVKQDEIENLLLGMLCLSRFGWLLL